jgi:hypothetical protein
MKGGEEENNKHTKGGCMIFDQTGAVEIDCSGIGSVQLYAKIKRSSKYYSQNEYAKRDKSMGFPFPIKFVGGHYMFRGGPGGQYRKEDVNIFVKLGNDFVRIS